MIDVGFTGIEILHFFQDIRGAIPDFITSIASFFTDNYLILALLLMSLFLWFIDKRSGQLIGLSFTAAFGLGMFVKNIVAQPRPWVIDKTLVPEGAKLSSYSLPSAHTITAVSSFGLGAFLTKNKALIALCLFVVIIIPFSRIYLGFHTPLDVLTGILLAVLVSVSLWVLFKHTYDDDRSYCIMLGALAAAYVLLTVAVYCQKHTEIYYFAPFAFAFILGFLIDRRYLSYKAPVDAPLLTKAALYCGGSLVTVLFYCCFRFVSKAGEPLGYAAAVAIGLWISVVYPYLIKRLIGSD